MEINAMIADPEFLDIAETSRSAVEKAFEFVKMKNMDPKSKDVVTSTGILFRSTRD